MHIVFIIHYFSYFHCEDLHYLQWLGGQRIRLPKWKPHWWCKSWLVVHWRYRMISLDKKTNFSIDFLLWNIINDIRFNVFLQYVVYVFLYICRCVPNDMMALYRNPIGITDRAGTEAVGGTPGKHMIKIQLNAFRFAGSTENRMAIACDLCFDKSCVSAVSIIIHYDYHWICIKNNIVVFDRYHWIYT